MTQTKSPTSRPSRPSSTAQAVLASHLGHDPVLQYLTRLGRPLTADSYIALNWGDLPEIIDPEDQELLDALREHETK